MALKPGDALRGGDFEDQVADAERRIDEGLRARGPHTPDGKVRIDVDLRWNDRVVAELLQRYQAAGWQVEHVQEPDGGDRLTFERKKG